jgi:hypothetical protein
MATKNAVRGASMKENHCIQIQTFDSIEFASPRTTFQKTASRKSREFAAPPIGGRNANPRELNSTATPNTLPSLHGTHGTLSRAWRELADGIP